MPCWMDGQSGQRTPRSKIRSLHSFNFCQAAISRDLNERYGASVTTPRGLSMLYMVQCDLIRLES